MTDHDALDAAMFWTGAMLAFAPLILGGVVLAYWWRLKKRGRSPGQS